MFLQTAQCVVVSVGVNNPVARHYLHSVETEQQYLLVLSAIVLTFELNIHFAQSE